MSRGGYFNSGSRRSGGDRPFRFVVPRVDSERAVLLAALKTQIANSGLTGDDLQEVYERLEATDTAVLREAVETSGSRTRPTEAAALAKDRGDTDAG